MVLLAQLPQRLTRGGMPQGPGAAREVLGPGMRVLCPHGPRLQLANGYLPERHLEVAMVRRNA
jgi:hypothetical protein